MRLVIVESPYAGETEFEIARNVAYARACMRDCIKHGDAPYASHLLYTQPGILEDKDPEERALGIKAGLEWGKRADVTVVYLNFGITEGMQWGIDQAKSCGRPVEQRLLSKGAMLALDEELRIKKRESIQYPLINPGVRFTDILEGRFQSIMLAFEACYGVVDRVVAESYERGLDHSPEHDEFGASLEYLRSAMKGDLK